jgi:hypothetical protein
MTLSTNVLAVNTAVGSATLAHSPVTRFVDTVELVSVGPLDDDGGRELPKNQIPNDTAPTITSPATVTAAG